MSSSCLLGETSQPDNATSLGSGHAPSLGRLRAGSAEAPNDQNRQTTADVADHVEAMLSGAHISMGLRRTSLDQADRAQLLPPPNSALQQRDETTSGPQQLPSPAQARRRKVSVFSHDGFPDIRLLDQQNLKVRSAQREQEQLERRNETSALQADAENSDAPMTAQITSSVRVSASPGALPSAAVTPREPSDRKRQVRVDTLGSTGSSRASSCDEPPIGPHTEAFSFAGRHAAGSLTITQTSAESCRQDSNHRDSACSSQSSLDDSHLSWAQSKDEQANQNDQQHQQAKAKSSACSKTPQFPPFESIKTQLKRNSMPNAQLIQRHIDNLISQNEAIVDNWNLVSIRSYNSRDTSLQAKRAANTSLVLEDPRQNKRWPFEGAEQRGQVERRISSSALQPGPQGGHRTKRASTTILLNPPSSLVSSARNIFEPHLSAQKRMEQVVVSSSVDSLISSSTQSQATSSGGSQPQHRLSSGSTNFGALESGQSSPKQSHCPTSADVAATTEMLKLFGSQLDRRSLVASQSGADVQPQHLESAIQNLSLKRRDDGYHNTLHLAGLTGADLGSQHVAGYKAGWSPQQQTEHQENLIETGQKQRDELMLAALLFERHRQPLIDLENQTAILRHQQQMIEQQQRQMDSIGHALDAHHMHSELTLGHLAPFAPDFQLAEQLSRASQHSHFLQHQQHQHQHMAFPPPTSFDQQLAKYQSRLSQRPTTTTATNGVADNYLLNNFLTKVMINTALSEESRDQAVGHTAQAQASLLELSRPETLAMSLESSTPLHRCDTCDIPFWTRDLLNYHLIAQCTGISQHYSNHLNYQLSASEQNFRRPLSFNFTGPNSFDHYLNGCQQRAPAKNRKDNLIEPERQLSPPKQSNHPPDHHSRSASPPRHSQELLRDVGLNAEARQQATDEIKEGVMLAGRASKSSMASEHISILKQQLLTEPLHPPEVEDQFLPFKKRKISEPNMKY